MFSTHPCVTVILHAICCCAALERLVCTVWVATMGNCVSLTWTCLEMAHISRAQQAVAVIYSCRHVVCHRHGRRCGTNRKSTKWRRWWGPSAISMDSVAAFWGPATGIDNGVTKFTARVGTIVARNQVCDILRDTTRRHNGLQCDGFIQVFHQHELLLDFCWCFVHCPPGIIRAQVESNTANALTGSVQGHISGSFFRLW